MSRRIPKTSGAMVRRIIETIRKELVNTRDNKIRGRTESKRRSLISIRKTRSTVQDGLGHLMMIMLRKIIEEGDQVLMTRNFSFLLLLLNFTLEEDMAEEDDYCLTK
jgi:hypothetical protein